MPFFLRAIFTMIKLKQQFGLRKNITVGLLHSPLSLLHYFNMFCIVYQVYYFLWLCVTLK